MLFYILHNVLVYVLYEVISYSDYSFDLQPFLDATLVFRFVKIGVSGNLNIHISTFRRCG